MVEINEIQVEQKKEFRQETGNFVKKMKLKERLE
jgi:hypothetical protein